MLKNTEIRDWPIFFKLIHFSKTFISFKAWGRNWQFFSFLLCSSGVRIHRVWFNSLFPLTDCHSSSLLEASLTTLPIDLQWHIQSFPLKLFKSLWKIWGLSKPKQVQKTTKLGLPLLLVHQTYTGGCEVWSISVLDNLLLKPSSEINSWRVLFSKTVCKLPQSLLLSCKTNNSSQISLQRFSTHST